jgi:AcrR family transcriptional regulator
MPKKNRAPRLSAADRRKAILLAAKEIFLAEGYERTTMRRIATALGITPTTLYLHFPDKAALMREICNASFEVLGAAMAKAAGPGIDPMTAFRGVFDAYIDFALSHSGEYRLTFMNEPPPGTSAHRPGVGGVFDPADKGAQAFAGFQALVGRLIRSGVFRAGDPTTMAEAAWAAVHGLAALLINRRDYAPGERAKFVDAVAQMIAEGLVKR